MAQSSWTDAGFVLGDWLIRPRHGTVERRAPAGANPLPLEPKVMAVLVCLARHAGQVVTRDEFVAEVWAGRVVSDESLSRCISELRKALGDDSHEPRYIRTIAKVGYTLLYVPEPLPSTGPPAPAEPVAAPAAAPLPRPRPRLRPVLWTGGAVAVAVAALAAYWLRSSEPPASEPPPPVTRLVVLPFDTREARDFGRDVGSELADEIADSLEHVERLRIYGRTSANALAAAHSGAIEAGRKLGVDALLEGAVAQSGDGLRVSARLIATSDGRVQWSNVYELKPAEIFAVQSSIASAVIRALVGGADSEGPTRVEPDSRDLQAYQLYLRGAHQVRLRGEDSLRRAVDLFSAAARRDPSYARAQVGLANAYSLLPSYTLEDPKEMYVLADKALAAAERVSGSRSMTAGAHAYLAFQRWHWIEAETAFRTAITAEPNNPDARQLYSQLLGVVGRLDTALQQARVAQELDPLAPVVADRIGILCLWLGEDAEAARSVELARELGLEEAAYPETKVILRLHEHADAQAIAGLRTLQHTLNRSDAWIEPTISAIRHVEQRPAAIEMLDRARRAGTISPRIYFGAMVLLGSASRAMNAFEALIDRDPNDLEFLFSADAAAVRRDPAFGPFVEKMGLVAYWDRFGWSGACRREGSHIVCH